MILKGIEIYLILEVKAGDDPLTGSCMDAKRETTLKIKHLTYEKKEMLQIGETWTTDLPVIKLINTLSNQPHSYMTWFKFLNYVFCSFATN